MKVGIVGLGAIGSAFAARLLARGEQVAGFDVAAAPMRELEALAAGLCAIAPSLPVIASRSFWPCREDALTGAAAAIAGVSAREGGLVIDVNTLAGG